MKQIKLSFVILMIVLAAVLVGCGDDAGNATDTPTPATMDDNITPIVETPMDTGGDMEMTEEADG